MNDYAKEKLLEASGIIEANISTLQSQVLNNLDEICGNGVEKIDKQSLDKFVKKPMMRAVTRLRLARSLILKAQSEGKLPQTQVKENDTWQHSTGTEPKS